MLRGYRTIYKMYIRSTAVHISKMTDNYAKHKYRKITLEKKEYAVKN